jgi:hypothetical protein
MACGVWYIFTDVSKVENVVSLFAVKKYERDGGRK